MNTYTLINGYVLDGTKTMKPYKANVEVIYGKITKIGDFKPKTSIVIDCTDQYILPGLINLHSHLPSSGKVNPNKKVANAKKLVKILKSNALGKWLGGKICEKSCKEAFLSGVTTVRAVGGVGNFDSVIRDKINKGKVIGPRLLVSNEAIGVVGGHMDGTVAHPVCSDEEAVRFVCQLKEENVDLIKLMITGGILDCEEIGKPGVLRMKPSMVKAACDKAHELGLKVAAHVESNEGVDVAILNGVDTIEHGSHCEKEVLEKLKAKKGALVTTLSPATPLAMLDQDSTGYGEVGKVNATALLKEMIEMAIEANKIGIDVGLGTDSGSPFITHYDFYRELIYYVNYCKVSPQFALHTATLLNAKIAGVDDVTGSIEVGKISDIIVVDSNPLLDLKTLGHIRFVSNKFTHIQNPTIKHIEGYDEMLDGFMEKAKEFK